MVAFVGAGKVAVALGLYFKTRGIEMTGYYSRNHDHAGEAARITGTRAFTSLEQLTESGQMIWITTTDDAIEEVACQIARLDIKPNKHKMFLHASGVHSASILHSLKEKGFTVCSAHPLLSFSTDIPSTEQLRNTWFSIETDEGEQNELVDFFKQTGNPVLRIDNRQKTLYHTACCILSNYLVTLADLSFGVFEKAGIEKEAIREATVPLMLSVLENIKNYDGKNALTGPLKRGDKNTIKLHLESLQKNSPEFVEIYKVLGRQTMKMLDDYRLSEILK